MSALSQADVTRLLAEPTPEVRAELAGKLGRENALPDLSSAEVGIAQDIIRVLARDIEESVRASLAQSLRNSRLLPHDVALRLAQDIDKVALPILSESQVLTSEDLIGIVQSAPLAKQCAIARRSDLPEEVSDVIMDLGGEGAVSDLLDNTSAHIGSRGYDRALDRFPLSEPIKEKMVLRESLPLAVSERLVGLVSERLGQRLAARHELSPGVAANIIMRSREASMLKFTYGRGEIELRDLAIDMKMHGRLTPFLILRALCYGDLAFFEIAMAVRAGVPVSNAQTLISDSGPKGLRALFDRCGFPERIYPAMRTALDVVRGVPYDGNQEELDTYRARILTRILTQFEAFDPDDLAYLMGKLGDYLDTAAERAA